MLISVGTEFGFSPAELLRPDSPRLGNVLCLLSKTFEFRLEFYHLMSHRRIIGLGTYGIGFPQHFLDEKVELTPNWLGVCRPRRDVSKLRDVASESNQFLGDIQAISGNHDFLMQPSFIDQTRVLPDLIGPAAQSFPSRLYNKRRSLLEGIDES